MSVVSTVYFLNKNNYFPSNLSKKNYKNILNRLFNNFALSDWDGFESKDFGLYNLAVIVAMHNEDTNLDISNDELKSKVKKFFEKSFVLH